MTVMAHVKALQAGHSSQGTSEPITPAWKVGCAENPPGGKELARIAEVTEIYVNLTI